MIIYELIGAAVIAVLLALGIIKAIELNRKRRGNNHESQ